MLAGRLGNFARYEIERKYLLEKLPTDLPLNYVDIKDTYLPNSSLRLRIEKSSEGVVIGRKLTKKDKAPEARNSTSIMTSLYLSERDLAALGEIKGQSLEKRRYILEDKDNRIVFDVFKGKLDGLIMAEIEFKDDESMTAFVPPDSAWKEVTDDPYYSGGNLAGLKK